MRPVALRAVRPVAVLLTLALLLGACGSGTPRALVVSPSSVTLSEIFTSRTVGIGYQGPAGSTAVVTTSVSDARISVTPTAFTLDAGASVAVTISASVENVSVSGTVRFASPGMADAVVAVTMAAGCFIDPAAPLAAPQAMAERLGPPEALDAYVPGELLVLYHEVATVAARSGPLARRHLSEDVAARAGVSVAQAGAGRGHDLLRVREDELDAAMARLQADPRVAHVSRNYVAHRLAPPPDQYYGAQWPLWGFGVAAAWEVEDGGGGGPDVVVAIVDDGVHVSHVDLVDKALPGRDIFCGDDDVRTHSDHGTHVAGIAAGASRADGLIVGVARGSRARLLPVKVFPDNISMGGTLTSVVRGLEWAAQLDGAGGTGNAFRADVINMSLGFGTSLSAGAVAILRDTIEAIVARGIVVVAASGNTGSGGGVTYPARLDAVIAVGSVDWERGRSSFSTYGAGLDVMAPGGTAPGSVASHPCSNGTRFGVLSAGAGDDRDVLCQSGTSMAAPFVAGTAALLIAHDPASYRGNPAAIAARLAATALQPGGYTSDQYGAGIVCPDAALGVASTCARP
jgi:serine protease